MFHSSLAIEIQEKYNSGERNFQNLQLRRADLRGINLSHANLQGSDLSYANLRDADLSSADLSEVYFNEADLTGANLSQSNLSRASLIKVYLIKANLQQAKLDNAYLTGAYVTKSNLKEASLNGAYLNGAKLSGADLSGAFYDGKTRFDATLDPVKLGMQKDYSGNRSVAESKVTVAELLATLNYLSKLSNHYLGSTMTSRYWQSSRPDFEWLQQFQINRSAQITFSGASQDELSPIQLEWAREWVIAFIKSCSQIVQNFSKMLDPKQMLFRIAPSGAAGVSQTYKTNELQLNSYSVSQSAEVN